LLVSSPPILPAVVSTHQASVSAVPSRSGKKHVLVALGLPRLSQKMVNRIVVGEYIDFNDLPKGSKQGNTINHSERSQLEYQVTCGARRMPALMPSASIGDLCCHPMGAAFASLWIIRLINAPTYKAGKRGIPKSLVVNIIIIMATVVLGINADLLTSAIHVEDPTPIPGAPRSEETMVKRGPEPSRD